MRLCVRRKSYLVLLLVAFTIFLLLAGLQSYLLINISPSMPIGIYRLITPNYLQRNAIVAVCLNDPARTYGLQRSYILASRRCDGSEPLVKSILAVPGDNIALKSDEIIVNGDHYFYQTFTTDSKKRPLIIWPRGDYKNTPDYWLIGTNDVKSWDSRYWGPVSQKQIIFVLKPLLIFH